MPTVGGDIIMASSSHLCSFPELHSLSDPLVSLQPQVPASALSASYSMSQWHLTQFINYSLQRFFFLTSRKSHFQFSFYLSGSWLSSSSFWSLAQSLEHLLLKGLNTVLQLKYYVCPYFSIYSTSPNLFLKLQSNHFWLLFCCSVAKLCLTLCDPMDCSRPGFPVLHYPLKVAQTHVHWVGDAIQQSLPLSLLLLPSISLRIKVFANESALHTRWPKYWSFSFSISPCNEYSGLISFRMD